MDPPRQRLPAEAPRAEQQRTQRTLEVIAAIRDARFGQGLRCPRCEALRVQRWGEAHGRQRYRCLDCRRTFSDLTGTPAAHLKKLDRLTRYLACMGEALTVRESARRTGIDPSTAFRWRHRLLDELREAPAPPLSGWIELDCFWLAHSRKGERGIRDRPARRRAPPCLITFSGKRVCVLLACDRVGGLVTDLAPRPRPDPDGLEALLAGRTEDEAEPVVLVSTRGRYGAEARVARRHGWGFVRARSGGVSGPLEGPEHVRTVVGYRARFVRWLRRFKGVATKYLANYLAWHRKLDAAARDGAQPSTPAPLPGWSLASGFG